MLYLFYVIEFAGKFAKITKRKSLKWKHIRESIVCSDVLVRLAILNFLFALFCMVHAGHKSFPDYLDISSGSALTLGAEDGVDPITDKATLKRLLKHAQFCSLVGESDEKIIEQFPKAQIFVTKKSKIKFFLVRDDVAETQMIVIRGSANLTNWIIDFKFWKIKDSWLDIRVHKGFYEATREVFWDSIFELNPTYKTTITGHSLGGAVAILLGMYLDNFGHPETDVITFGQPRITNKSGAAKYKEFPFHRVVIAADLIPHLPPKFVGYKHFGNKWYLKPKDSLTLIEGDSDEQEDPKEALELWEEWAGDVDHESLPVATPPILSTMWLSMRDPNPPDSMKELFSSKEWKRLKAIHGKATTATSKNRVFELQGSTDNAPTLERDPRGNWFKWHALERYLAQLRSLIEMTPR